ncbi:MAG: hypothetical protein ACRDNZ_06010, partial [Streptosporangiaceae bacterium]
MTVTEFPRPAAEPPPDRAPRWIPSRAGIVNVWRYYDEVFTFHDGRLLLRGPNGSGKSKALELLLPFLLDANLRASRLSTFGTGERTMHWNLMGEGASGTTRVGYVWLEFRLPGSPDEWFCCGCRLQASTHTTTVHADYFTTRLRVGTPAAVPAAGPPNGAAAGVALVNSAGQPLTRTALEESLGSAGVVHGNAGDYRAAVRAALFPGLTEQRYDALITALLQLRTPKLSQRLDPALLSTLLSRALPPLGHQEITDLAEGFERLDRQRERLVTLDQEVAATRTLAARQRSYAQRVLRAGAAALISATTDLDSLTKTARRSGEEYEVVCVREKEAEARGETLESEVAAAQARAEGITHSEAYQQGRELDKLRQQAAQAEASARSVQADAERKRSEARADESRHQAARGVADRQDGLVQTLAADARNAATRAGMTSVQHEISAILDNPQARPRQLLRAAIHSRREQLAGVAQALGDHDRAVQGRQQAEADLDQARTQVGDAREQQEAAATGYELALTALGDALTRWASACRELDFPEPGAFLDLLESEPAVLRLVDSVAGALLERIARDESVTEARLTAAGAQREDLLNEVRHLAGERDLPPA